MTQQPSNPAVERDGQQAALVVPSVLRQPRISTSGNMQTCPHCSQKGLPLVHFLRSTERKPVTCTRCGEFAYAPRWIPESALALGLALFWFSPLVALVTRSWVPVLLAVPLYCLWWIVASRIARPHAYDNDGSKMNFRRPVGFGHAHKRENGDAV